MRTAKAYVPPDVAGKELIALRLDDDIKAALDKYAEKIAGAEELDTSRSAVIRSLLRKALIAEGLLKPRDATKKGGKR